VGVLFFLIPLALVVVTAAVLAFRWALTDGQFDDLDTPSLRVLVDEAPSAPSRT
jgi:cbb3-type cytochrome oxidase maturation protein